MCKIYSENGVSKDRSTITDGTYFDLNEHEAVLYVFDCLYHFDQHVCVQFCVSLKTSLQWMDFSAAQSFKCTKSTHVSRSILCYFIT